MHEFRILSCCLFVLANFYHTCLRLFCLSYFVFYDHAPERQCKSSVARVAPWGANRVGQPCFGWRVGKRGCGLWGS